MKQTKRRELRLALMYGLLALCFGVRTFRKYQLYQTSWGDGNDMILPALNVILFLTVTAIWLWRWKRRSRSDETNINTIEEE